MLSLAGAFLDWRRHPRFSLEGSFTTRPFRHVERFALKRRIHEYLDYGSRQQSLQLLVGISRNSSRHQI
jgi:hypothetical protein